MIVSDCRSKYRASQKKSAKSAKSAENKFSPNKKRRPIGRRWFGGPLVFSAPFSLLLMVRR
jgi:hypothetical protein